MASGFVYRFAKTQEDGSIKGERIIHNSDGSLTTISEIVFDADSSIFPSEFTDEINRLIDEGVIDVPSDLLTTSHIVDISDELEEGRYTYNFVDKDGGEKEASDIYRIFLNGLNVSEDIDISEDRLSFTFIEEYEPEVFGYEDSRLVIDFVENS
jgi:hypothetical protein